MNVPACLDELARMERAYLDLRTDYELGGLAALQGWPVLYDRLSMEQRLIHYRQGVIGKEDARVDMTHLRLDE